MFEMVCVKITYFFVRKMKRQWGESLMKIGNNNKIKILSIYVLDQSQVTSGFKYTLKTRINLVLSTQYYQLGTIDLMVSSRPTVTTKKT